MESFHKPCTSQVYLIAGELAKVDSSLSGLILGDVHVFAEIAVHSQELLISASPWLQVFSLCHIYRYIYFFKDLICLTQREHKQG